MLQHLLSRDIIISALMDMGARCIGGFTSGNEYSANVISMYSIGGRVLITNTMFGSRKQGKRLDDIESRDYNGIDVFVPVCDKNNIDETIAAIRRWKEENPATHLVAVGSLGGGMSFYGPFTENEAQEKQKEVDDRWQIGTENVEIIALSSWPV